MSSDLLQNAENKLGAVVAGAEKKFAEFVHTAGQDLDDVLSEIKIPVAKLESMVAAHRAKQQANSAAIAVVSAEHDAKIAELTTENGNLETEALHIESIIIAIKAAV